MGSKLSVVQMLNGVLHVLVANELNYASAILVHIGVADIAGLPHVVLQILPATSGRQASDDATVLRASSRRSTTTRSIASSATASTAGTATSALLELDAELMAVIVVAITALYRVLGIERVLELDEGVWRSFTVLQVNVLDLAVLVEDVFDVLGANILGQVA